MLENSGSETRWTIIGVNSCRQGEAMRAAGTGAFWFRRHIAWNEITPSLLVSASLTAILDEAYGYNSRTCRGTGVTVT